MSKVNLKDNIWIEGYSNKDMSDLKTDYACDENLIYEGKTSEISEELAKKYVKNWRCDGLYNNYKIESQYEEYLFNTAKESIQSACPKEYCIIYKL